MIIERIGQGLRFIFGRYDRTNDIIVKKTVSDEEFEIFDSMSEYEKIHSFRLYSMVCADPLLKNMEIYKKLALLHDCGKGNVSLFRRVKKVLIGDRFLESHPDRAFEKLVNINPELASLAKKHHSKPENEMMKRFQELDDK